MFLISLIFAGILTTAGQEAPVQQISVEVFQVLDLPVTITETALVKTKDGYLLKCSLTNNSEFPLIGLRYSLVVADSMNTANIVAVRDESLKLAESQTKAITFKTPIKVKLKTGERLVLMLDEVGSVDYTWRVIKAKEALGAYINSDYSVVPRVVRMSNQVDTRPGASVIY
ncbi:MAG TPA: hypothetical protein VJW17_03845 [Pyrinomonadaceae bacterium]|nr:hypothetical protein [Pyrinomonadaceae bacterium]